MKQAKKYIIFTLLSIIITLFSFASANFFMDPLWTFEHENKFNQYQRGRKERQQKSNALYFRSKKYDTLIFGSSRSTYINQHKINDHTFNYAVSDMQPREYKAYLDFAITQAKQPIKNVIIGLDFFGALEYEPFISKEPQLILDKISEPFYRYKLLLSVDTLHYSLYNIKNYFKKPYNKYTYNYIKTSPPKGNIESFNKNIYKDINIYLRDRYSKKYDENYKKYISELKNEYPNINFIVFTTPVTNQHFKAMIKANLYKSYERWIKESVEVFGKVNHFMYLNDLTNNSFTYFKDSNHAYASTYECLIKETMHNKSKCKKIDILIDNSSTKTVLKKLMILNFNKEQN